MNSEDSNIILLIDDDAFLRSIFFEYFSRAGFRVYEAGDGLEALEIFAKVKPTVVVADLFMPRMDGIQFLEQIRKDGVTTPVIVTTGHPDLDSALKAVHGCIFDFIIKPVQLEYLHQKVCKAIENVRLAKENALLNELVSLHQISTTLNKTHNLQQVLDITFTFCLEITGADSGSIQLVNKEKKQLAIVRHKGINPNILSTPIDDDSDWPISKLVLKSGRSLLIPSDTTITSTGIAASRTDIGSSVVVPLKISDEVIGIVTLNRNPNRSPLTLIDQNKAEVIAAQASIAIKNAHLYESIKQKLDEVSLISTYSEKLMSITDEDNIIRFLFDTVDNHFTIPIDIVGLLKIQKRGIRFVYLSKVRATKVQIENICRKIIKNISQKIGSPIESKKVQIEKLNEMVKPHDRQFQEVFSHIVPIVSEHINYGALYFACSSNLENQREHLSLLSGLVNQTRIALENAKLYSDLKENYIRTIKALAIAVDAKDTYTHGHSENVMNIAAEICIEMGIGDKWLQIIRDAGLLHDIGKIGVPGHILNKAGALTLEEFNGIMKTHTLLGANIVKDVPFLQELHELILHHHEHFDGSGYPDGLSGHNIPLGARIIHVADAYEAMTSNRPYRSSLSCQEAIRRLRDGAGKQFDPDVVDAFIRVAKKRNG